ncbi:MAG: hypothetical protein ACXAD7_17845 [Candidatus Kariarchaeaceae archaeon]|jgi:hypothetical protein
MNDLLMALFFPFGFIFIFWAIVPTYLPILFKKIFRDPTISGFGRKLDTDAGSLEREVELMRVKAFNTRK